MQVPGSAGLAIGEMSAKEWDQGSTWRPPEHHIKSNNYVDSTRCVAPVHSGIPIAWWGRSEFKHLASRQEIEHLKAAKGRLVSISDSKEEVTGTAGSSFSLWPTWPGLLFALLRFVARELTCEPSQAPTHPSTTYLSPFGATRNVEGIWNPLSHTPKCHL